MTAVKPMPSLARRRPRRAAPIIERPIGGDLALYDPERARLHLLNATAALIWRLCDGERSPEAIGRLVTAHFPESHPPTIQHDLDIFLRRLSADGLVT